jgi:two-component system, cell cycle sensor histidine kinase and response regulator CckA
MENDDNTRSVTTTGTTNSVSPGTTEQRDTDERFRAIFDNHHVVMLILDPETGRIEDASPAACAFYGYSRDALRKKRIGEINTLPPEQAFERLQLAKSRQQKYFDFQHRLASGEIRDVEVCTGPIVMDGRTLLFSVINDVTDRKLAEAALLESEEKYRNLFQNAPIGIFRSTPQGTVLNVNPAYAQIYGYESPEEVIDSVKDVAAQLYMEPEKRRQIIEKVLRHDRLLNFENEYRRKDGTLFTGNLHLQVVRNNDGSVSHLEGFVEDITERKKAEDAVRESEEKFAKVFRNSPDAITLTDLTNNTLVDVNESYTRISGYSREESIGRTTVELGLNQDDLYKFITALREQGRVLNFEAPFRTKSGKEIICSISGELMELGGKPHLLGVIRDHTERKRAEEALRESEARVRTKLDTILSPAGDIGTLELADVIDAQAIQALMDDFFNLTNIGVGIIDLEGKVLVATGWQEICTKFHRAHPETCRHCIESDTELSGSLEQGSSKLYHCKNNMWDIATPISVGGKHLGNLFLGQFLFEDESPDYEVFSSQARQYGFDEQQYLAALDKVPRWSRQTVDTVMAFYSKLAGILSTLGFGNIKLARSLAEQERLLNSLRESEQRYRAVIDNIEVGISLLNSDMEIVDVNRAFKEYFPRVQPGCAQICYEQYNDPPRSEPCSYCPCVLTLQDGKVHEAITETPTGSETRCYHLVSSPIKDSLGQVQYVIELTEDITERKQAEELLKQAEHRYRRLFEDAPLMSVITRNEQGAPFIIDCNELFLRSVGYSRQEVVGQPLANFYSPTSSADLLEGGGYARAMAGEFFMGERQLVKRDGGLIPTLLYTAPEVALSGEVIGTCAMFVDITEQKRAEEALIRSEAQLSEALIMAHLGHWEYDVTKDLFTFNDHFYKIFHTTVEQVGGYTMSSEDYARRFVHPDDIVVVANEIRKALEATDPLFSAQLEHRIIYADGEIGYITVRHFVVKDELGRTVATYGVNQDITDRKMAEEALRESEAKYRSLFNNAEVGMFRTRLDGSEILDMNERFLRIFGRTRDEMQGNPSFIHWVDQNERKEMVRRLKADGSVTDFECRMLNEQGEVRECVTSLRLNSEQGLLEGSIIDVTDRKQAEEALRSEREQLLSIFESINEVILVIDPSTYEILYANKFTEDLYGKTLKGGNCYEQLNSLDSSCQHCAMDRAIALQGKPNQWEYHNPVLNRDFLATDRMIRWSDGRNVKFQIAVDITERKLAEQEKENLRSQLLQAQKMEAVGTLAGGIAHDFNNLLQVASGYSELLLQQKNKDDPEYADLLKIFQAAKNGAELVHSLLTFSRKVEPRPIVLNLNTQIVQVDKLLRRTIPKMIAIRLVLSSDLADINADPTQMEQILMNLAINASDAMPDGGSLTIATRTATIEEEYCRYHAGATPGEYVVLAVTDTGHGMDKDTVEHIFEPFYTTKEIGRGTGLGLAMVYGIVTQHGGHIVCDSEVGRGTTFNIYLPAVPASAEPVVESSGEMPAFGTETVLLVDDEDLIRELGGRILKRSGYTVLTAANGEEALRVYDRQKEHISLVILDLMMPTMGGKDCLKELLRINPQAKVLIASGYSADASTREILALGAKGFVAKPFKFKGLLQQVRKALDQN